MSLSSINISVYIRCDLLLVEEILLDLESQEVPGESEQQGIFQGGKNESAICFAQIHVALASFPVSTPQLFFAHSKISAYFTMYIRGSRDWERG